MITCKNNFHSLSVQVSMLKFESGCKVCDGGIALLNKFHSIKSVNKNTDALSTCILYIQLIPIFKGNIKLFKLLGVRIIKSKLMRK